MVFTEPEFLFFFLPVLMGLSFVLNLPGRLFKRTFPAQTAQNYVLLAFSLLFYAYGETFYILVMLFSIVANYVFGLAIERYRERAGARYAIACSIVFNLGLLSVFKYGNFLIDNINVVLNSFGAPLFQNDPIHLPLGISFFTFQAMSYTLDVYRKDAVAQRSLASIALYISLFPQLIAGPIVRYHDVRQQLSDRYVSSDLFASGVRRFLIGLGKKVIIANAMALPADALFDSPANELTFHSAWLATACYSLQIYFDFSGYSDMAIGLGRMFGFRFLENFNYPYISTSVTEFWRRWHISLSTWFRDYVYIPLGGNRHGPRTTYRNLVIVFSLCGLWHGASWTFILWGMFHGFFLILERVWLLDRLASTWRPFRHCYLLLVISLGWCIFRAGSLGQLAGFVTAMAGLNGWTSDASITHFQENTFLPTFVAGLILSSPVLRYVRAGKEWACSRPGLLSAVIWNSVEILGVLFIGLYSVMLIAADTYNPFIYFRF